MYALRYIFSTNYTNLYGPSRTFITAKRPNIINIRAKIIDWESIKITKIKSVK